MYCIYRRKRFNRWFVCCIVIVYKNKATLQLNIPALCSSACAAQPGSTGLVVAQAWIAFYKAFLSNSL